MKKVLIILLTAFICNASQINSNNEVGNRSFKIKTTNISGKSMGVLILFMFGATPSESKAVSNLIQKAHLDSTKNQTITNLNVSRRYIVTPIGLFMIDYARADVVEYE